MEGLKIIRALGSKEQYSQGIVVSLGNEVPEAYKDMKIGQTVNYFHQAAIELGIERGVDYHLLRFSDIWGEL